MSSKYRCKTSFYAGVTGGFGGPGFTGSTGATGFPGQVGSTGFTGGPGPAGFTGETGSQGFPGTVFYLFYINFILLCYVLINKSQLMRD